VVSPPVLPSPSSAATAPARGMGFDSLPLSISPTIFGFLKTLALQIVGKDLGNVPPVFGWELVPYDPIMVESTPEGACSVGSNDVLDEPFFNFGPVEQIVGSDRDESDSAVEVQQIQTIPQTTFKPTEWVPNVGLRPPFPDLFLYMFVNLEPVVWVLPQLYHFQRMWSSPLLKNLAQNLPRNQPLLLLKEPRNQPKRKRLPNRSPNMLRRLSHQGKGHHPKRERLLNRCLTSLKKLRSQRKRNLRKP